MSFLFGFTLADVLDDDFEQAPAVTAPLSVTKPQAPATIAPQLHDLNDILASLHNVRITFDNFTTPNGNIVYRRELFDIKHQAMTEEGSGLSPQIQDILLGAKDLDIQKNVYEGGFKLWECSYDLVDEIGKLDLAHNSCFLELGCGSALPSCFLFLELLKQHHSGKSLVVADFNYDVLRLVTVPNLLIHWALTLLPEALYALQNQDIPPKNDEFEVTQPLIDAFLGQLAEKKLLLRFVSGSWGPEFHQLVGPWKPSCILSSETIYSPETMPIFRQLLEQFLLENAGSVALVAAKYYYFGVGGSIQEFTQGLQNVTCHVSDPHGQLKRAILELRARHSDILSAEM